MDPLPNDHVLQTMLKSNTTFLVGRKGTGKSTVFQRAQHELRKAGKASAYIDIKTIYESSQVDPGLAAKLSAMPGAMNLDEMESLLLHRAFLAAMIRAIREEIKSRIKVSLWQKVKNSVGGSVDDLFEGLDALLEAADADRFISVVSTRLVEERRQDSDEVINKQGVSGKVGAGATGPEASLAFEDQTSYTFGSERERQFADILVRVFDIKSYILQLKELLNRVGLTQLFVFVDDFSELPPPAMQVVVDALLGPLNNWSEELIKFKIAAYPGRIYYGQIDKTKIDEISLDIYSLYGTADIAGMEEKAVDFTRRLITRRLEHFGVQALGDVFDTRRSGGDELWRQLFFATMANPRNIGYVLYFMYESNLIYGQKINLASIRDAARRYYEEKIEAYFAMNRFLHESFDERSSIFSLKELLDALVIRARELRYHTTSAVMRDLEGRPPTSHFHVATQMEALLATLELNFFITKYYVMSDRDGRKVTVYALNYGLCQKQSIEFGRPEGKREYRLYYVERVFDVTAILQEYVRMNQEIVCDSCGHNFDHEALPALQMFDMLCPECRTGKCVITNLSKKYEATLREIDPELLLPKVELGILHTLGTEERALYAAEVAGELDCSYQLVGKRAVNLAERGLVDRDKFDQGRRELRVTELAQRTYLRDLVEDVEPD
ncbi:MULTISPECIES: MarR family transcriptional regulator [unclassified Nocardioides]|uniref:MarR family transcriptional regulator n=1 Tax=unclassified Nocardioides TaxID=2615069 RepID=UPI0011204B57|nr:MULTISPECIES: MarR family transcriptional regulator [unclassified Nocardioides]